MNPIVIRRLVLFVAVLIATICLGMTFNYWRFSPQHWLTSHLAIDGAVISSIGDDERGTQRGTELRLENISIETDQFFFSAQKIDLTFNIISVLIGKPNLSSAIVESPYLESDGSALAPKMLRALITSRLQMLTIHNGLVITNNSEIQHVEFSLHKSGQLGDYALQTSAIVSAENFDMQTGFSATVSVTADDLLLLSDCQFDNHIQHSLINGHIAGKVKSAQLSASNSLSFNYASWTASWSSDLEHWPETLDWAGGVVSGQWGNKTLNLTEFDTAIAYVDDASASHIFAIQSNKGQWNQEGYLGKIALSLLTDYAAEQEVDSYNLVMSGAFVPSRIDDNSINGNRWTWLKPIIRIGIINADQQTFSNTFDAESLSVDASQNMWTLQDGQWQLTHGEQPAGDFGFGALRGSWPAMELTDAADIAQRQIQPTLTLIQPDIEYLHALFSQLVP